MTDEAIAIYEAKVLYTLTLWERCRADYGMLAVSHYPLEQQKFIVAFGHDNYAYIPLHDAAFMLVSRLQEPKRA